MSAWFKFCKRKVDKIEKVWNRKLEDDSEQNSTDDNDTDSDHAVNDPGSTASGDLASQGDFLPSVTRHGGTFHKPSEQDPDLVAAKKEAFTGTQDDMAVKPTYSDNQFWKTPELYDLDELLKEAE